MGAPADAPEDEKEVAKEAGIVLDALAAMLQHYGQHPFDVDGRSADEIRRITHAWKMHATVGAPRPDHETDKSNAGIFYRDWRGLVS